MHIDKPQAVETLMNLEKLERQIGPFKTAGGIKNFINFRKLKKDLEPASYGVKMVDVNEKDFLQARARISKFLKK
jgi:hypothetical protein